jgi:ribosomal protein S18 acetylase RimI-like enzyme
MTSPALELRPAAPSDQKAFFALHVLLFRDEIQQIWGWDDESQWENFKKEWDEARTLAIYHHGVLAGWVQTTKHPDHLYLLNLAIDPQFQNRGIGSAVISWLQQEAGARAIELQVFRTNPRVLALYQRLGFEITEELDSGFRLRWCRGRAT